VTLDRRLTGLFNGAMLLLAEFLLLNNDDASNTNKLRRAYSTADGGLFAASIQASLFPKRYDNNIMIIKLKCTLQIVRFTLHLHYTTAGICAVKALLYYMYCIASFSLCF